jgi:hypothetical protein
VLLGLSWLDPARASNVSEDLPYSMFQPIYDKLSRHGWWSIFIDQVPELGVVGQNYEDLLDRIKVLAGNLFRARGETLLT